MRRRPTDNSDLLASNVFSSDAWGSNDQTYVPQENTVDLSQYAAPLIPEGHARSARSARYSPSPHSSQYEPSRHVTNSESDPFTHASYDGQPVAPAPQNSRVDEMPSPVRRTRLGEPIPSIAPEGIASGFASPTNHVIQPPVQTSAPVETFEQPQVQEPVQQHENFAPPQAYEPVASPQVQESLEVEEEIPLSDFEEEFNAIKVVSSPTVEEEIDLTQDIPVVNAQAWAAPALFSSAPVISDPEISYHDNDDFFGTQYGNESDEDRLYRDPKEPRETVQIDMEFITRHLKNLTTNKIAIIIIAIILAATAYLIMKPSTSSPKQLPVNSSSQSPTGKTIVTAPADAQPIITVPPANPDAPRDQSTGGGAIVRYDENGNAVYTQAPNQNFNGD